jgi:hypothetical protein
MIKRMKLRFIAFFLSALVICSFLYRYAAAEEGTRIGVGVLQFDDGAVSGKRAELIADIIAREIAVSETLSVDLELGASGPFGVNAAVEVGRQVGLRYVVLWTLREINEMEPITLPTSADVSADRSTDRPLFRTAVTASANATLEARIVDVRTSEVRFGLSETGSSSTPVSLRTEVSRDEMEEEFGRLTSKAIVSAAALLGRAVRGIAGEETPLIVSVAEGEFSASVGTRNGVKVGDHYVVYAQSHWDKMPIALIRVREVGESRSVLVPVRSSGARVLRGDALALIEMEEAESVRLSPSREPTPPDEKPVEDAVSIDIATSADIGGGNGNVDDLIGELARRAEADGTIIIAGVSGDRIDSAAPAASEDYGSTIRGLVNIFPAPTETPANPGAGAHLEIRAGTVDRDRSTGLDVIETFPLSPIDRSNLHLKQRDARNLYERERYGEAFDIFRQLVDSYKGNYLSAYWAGMAALKLENKKDAAVWFDRALTINPNYQPAVEAKEKMK